MGIFGFEKQENQPNILFSPRHNYFFQNVKSISNVGLKQVRDALLSSLYKKFEQLALTKFSVLNFKCATELIKTLIFLNVLSFSSNTEIWKRENFVCQAHGSRNP